MKITTTYRLLGPWSTIACSRSKIQLDRYSQQHWAQQHWAQQHWAQQQWVRIEMELCSVLVSLSLPLEKNPHPQNDDDTLCVVIWAQKVAMSKCHTIFSIVLGHWENCRIQTAL